MSSAADLAPPISEMEPLTAAPEGAAGGPRPPGWQYFLRHLPLLPRSLAARTSLLLIVSLAVIEMAGFAIEAHDRINFERRFASHQALARTIMLYRAIAETPADERADELAGLHAPSFFHAALADQPDPAMTREMDVDEPAGLLFSNDPGGLQHYNAMHRLRDQAHFGPDGFPGPPDHPELPGGMGDGPHGDGPGDLPPGGPPMGGPPMEALNGGHPEDMGGMPPPFAGEHGPPGPPLDMRPNDGRLATIPRHLRPQRILTLPNESLRTQGIAFLLPKDSRWLVVHYTLPAPNPFTSRTFPLAFLIMTAGGGTLIIWGVRRLVAPVGTLAAAAEALAPDDNAPPLPEDGPLEIARAAAAFNAMATRIRRFVTDRTLLLTAIGHDLRTPITRMKLRAEFIDDDELREKFLVDLNELAAMVDATLAFGRDSARREAFSPLNLTALLQTILDEMTESHPDLADAICLVGDPPPIVIRARPLGLKRALANLIGNAIAYGGSARVTLSGAEKGAAANTAPGKKGVVDMGRLGPSSANHVTICIEDDGPGLPAADLERMFEPFVRAEESRNRETGGTGLGLAIARTNIRGQGGDVVLKNRQPHGLSAIVTLAA